MLARLAISALVVLLVAGCITQPTPQPTIAVACIPLRDYSPDDQKVLATAVSQLPATSPLVSAMEDYGSMRAADRACLAASPPPGVPK